MCIWFSWSYNVHYHCTGIHTLISCTLLVSPTHPRIQICGQSLSPHTYTCIHAHTHIHKHTCVWALAHMPFFSCHRPANIVITLTFLKQDNYWLEKLCCFSGYFISVKLPIDKEVTFFVSKVWKTKNMFRLPAEPFSIFFLWINYKQKGKRATTAKY